MPRRLVPLVNGEIYHVYNRGVEKRKIFLDERDYQHFIETIEHYQKPNTRFSTRNQLKAKDLDRNNLVEVLAYCLMPNHFHLLLKQTSENGISTFMSHLANSFTKYFNVKRDRVGPLLQGSFKVIRVENDDQLIHLSRYIHLNPLVSEITKDLRTYSWSSYLDYVSESTNGLVLKEEVLAHFSSSNSYEQFVLDQVDYAKTLESIKHQTLE